MLAELAGHLRGPPGSAALRSLHAPQEVFVLDNWRPWEAALRAAGWEELVTVGEPSLNVNTASGQLLRLAWRLPEDSLALLLAARHERPLRGVGDLEGVLGMYLQQLPAENWSRLASATHLYGADRASVIAQITKPRQGVMPAWVDRLDAATIKSLAVYVHSLGGGE